MTLGLLVIFQPHLYSRTRMLADQFARTFERLADQTIVVPVYGARQDPEPGVTGGVNAEAFADAAGAWQAVRGTTTERGM